ncbi:MAG: hypothetical protein ACOYM4_11400, partial [Nodosilinea sp.]
YESDITLLMLRYPVDVDALATILKRYILATNWVELEQIIDDIQARMARFQQRQVTLEQEPEGEP